VPADIWYDYLATCTGTLTVSTCGTADYDTKLAIYHGFACPVSDAEFIDCAEDSPGCPNFTSTLVVPVTCGQEYKIRVGGWMGAQGTGVLTVSCAPDPAGFNYCTATPNSTGSPAVMSYSGSASVSANDLQLIASSAPADQNGLFIYSPDVAALPLENGVLCLGNTTLGFILRLPFVTTDTTGTMTHTLDNTSPPDRLGQIEPGSTWRFQAWFRDVPAGGAGFDFSDGLELLFCP